MCDVCGCGETTHPVVEVHESLLSRNQHRADHLRAHFRADRVLAINIMGSPGSGKTALLEATSRHFAGARRLTAVSGDLATTRDADRLNRAGIRSMSITTGTACHLDANMVEAAVLASKQQGASLVDADYFFIENVGNLVCPALFDVGQMANVVTLSVTEGVDKPVKYPVMFRNADLVVVTKCDLLPYLEDVSLEAIEESLKKVMPRPHMMGLAATKNGGIDPWTSWLETLRTAELRRPPRPILPPIGL